MKKRCTWVGENKNMILYHDNEWGRPCHDDKILFEYLILDTFQAGLSWQIILNKRENFRKAFSNFNPLSISKYGHKDKKRLLNDFGIVRNRLKIDSAVDNAKAYLAIKKEFESFDKYLWDFIGGKPIKNRFKKLSNIPASTPLSDNLSKDLKKRGFRFVGTTVVYAFMQGAGLVNDHLTDCFVYKKLDK